MKKIKWIKLADRAYLPFSFSLNGSQNSKKYLKKYGNFKNEDKAIMYQHRFYWPEKEIKIIADYQINKYRAQGSSYLWSMAKKCEKSGEVFIKKIKQISLKKTDSRKQITHNLSLIIEEYRKFVVFMTIPWVLDNFLGEELNTILTKRNLLKRVELEGKLNQPMRMNEGELEQISLLQIVCKMKNQNDFSLPILKKIKKHTDEYGWLPIRWFVGDSLKKEDLIERLKNIFTYDPKEKLSAFKNQTKKIEKETKQIIRELNLNNKEKDFIYLLKEYVFIRTYRSDIINQANFITIPVLKKASIELGLEYNDVLFLSYQELLDCLNNIKKLKYINIPERKESWLLYRDAENITVLSGKKALSFATQQGVLEEKFLDMSEIRGVIAYQGITSGIIKVIHNPNDIGKVNKNDVLVATMTFPSYIAAMERASAFVTDEGGILCHAAIIAREMKKPCIIATKIATKVLKDGDLVEVDANKGIVKVLKRAV